MSKKITLSDLEKCFKCGEKLTINERFGTGNIDHLCNICRRNQDDKLKVKSRLENE